MTSIRRTIASWLLLLSSAVLLAQSTPLPKYRVIKGYPPRDDAAAINAAADHGYRLLFVYNFVVMRLEATPPDTYRYAPLPEFGGSGKLLNALNQQGALGYRWSERAGILEKDPHPRNYEYKMPEGFTGRALARSRELLLDQGFQIVHDFGASAIFMREIGTTVPGAPRKEVLMADALKQENVMKHVSELAAQGYRYRSQALSKKGGGKAVAMEECDSTCGGPFEYRSFDVKDADQLERDLNALGRDGFRVAAKSLAWPPHMAERPARHAQNFAYRVVPASGDSAMEKLLNQMDGESFVPVGVTAHVGWSLHSYVVLEKATVLATP